MTYEIKDVHMHADCGCMIGTDTVGIIDNDSDLASFIDDYRYLRHNIPSLLLNKALTDEFTAWHTKYDEILNQERHKGLMHITGMFGSAAVGHGYGILTNLGGLYKDLAVSCVRENKQPQSFLTVSFHARSLVNSGHLAVCLALDSKGRPYEKKIGTAGWAMIFERVFMGRRLV